MAADFNDQEIALVANLSTAKLPWWPIFEHMRSVSNVKKGGMPPIAYSTRAKYADGCKNRLRNG